MIFMFFQQARNVIAMQLSIKSWILKMSLLVGFYQGTIAYKQKMATTLRT